MELAGKGGKMSKIAIVTAIGALVLGVGAFFWLGPDVTDGTENQASSELERQANALEAEADALRAEAEALLAQREAIAEASNALEVEAAAVQAEADALLSEYQALLEPQPMPGWGRKSQEWRAAQDRADELHGEVRALRAAMADVRAQAFALREEARALDADALR